MVWVSAYGVELSGPPRTGHGKQGLGGQLGGACVRPRLCLCDGRAAKKPKKQRRGGLSRRRSSGARVRPSCLSRHSSGLRSIWSLNFDRATSSPSLHHSQSSVSITQIAPSRHRHNHLAFCCSGCVRSNAGRRPGVISTPRRAVGATRAKFPHPLLQERCITELYLSKSTSVCGSAPEKLYCVPWRLSNSRILLIVK